MRVSSSLGEHVFQDGKMRYALNHENQELAKLLQHTETVITNLADVLIDRSKLGDPQQNCKH